MSTLAVAREPRALGARCTEDELIVRLAKGRAASVPVVWFSASCIRDSWAARRRNFLAMTGA